MNLLCPQCNRLINIDRVLAAELICHGCKHNLYTVITTSNNTIIIAIDHNPSSCLNCINSDLDNSKDDILEIPNSLRIPKWNEFGFQNNSKHKP